MKTSPQRHNEFHLTKSALQTNNINARNLAIEETHYQSDVNLFLRFFNTVGLILNPKTMLAEKMRAQREFFWCFEQFYRKIILKLSY